MPSSSPYIINFSLKNIKPETFIHAMAEEEVYLSTQSACSSGDISRSLEAVFHDREMASHSIRISLSYKNTDLEIKKFLEVFDRVYRKLLIKND